MHKPRFGTVALAMLMIVLLTGCAEMSGNPKTAIGGLDGHAGTVTPIRTYQTTTGGNCREYQTTMVPSCRAPASCAPPGQNVTTLTSADAGNRIVASPVPVSQIATPRSVAAASRRG